MTKVPIKLWTITNSAVLSFFLKAPCFFKKKVTSDTGNGTAQCSVKWRVEGRNKESFYGSVSRCVGRRPLRNKSSRHPPPPLLLCWGCHIYLYQNQLKFRWYGCNMLKREKKICKLNFCFERSTALSLSSWATDSWSTKLFLDIMSAASLTEHNQTEEVHWLNSQQTYFWTSNFYYGL